MSSKPKIIVHELEDWNYPHTNGYYDMVNKEIHVLEKNALYEWTLYHEANHYFRRKKFTTVMAAYFQNPISLIIATALTLLGALISVYTHPLAIFFFATPLIIFLLCYFYEELFMTNSSWKEFKILKKAGVLKK
jgi:hypothetical protein